MGKVGNEAADGAAGWAREIMDGKNGQDDQETGQGAPPAAERGELGVVPREVWE